MPRQWIIAVLVSLILLVPFQTVWAESACGDLCRPDTTQATPRAAYCFTRVLAFGSVSVNTGCYTFYILGTPVGSFLGLAPGASLIPPGQLVRLNTPAGANIRGTLFYLLPILAGANVRMPVDTIQLASLLVNLSGNRVTFLMPQTNVRLAEGNIQER